VLGWPGSGKATAPLTSTTGSFCCAPASESISLTQAAFDQAHRAVNELLQDVIQPTFYVNNPARG
jgi:hypothetical protein